MKTNDNVGMFYEKALIILLFLTPSIRVKVETELCKNGKYICQKEVQFN